MTTLLVLLTLPAVPAAEADAHEKINPLYKQLRQQGVAIADKKIVPLPLPRMADGLDAVAQKKVIQELLGDDIDYDRFLEATVTAPYLLLPLTALKDGNPNAPGRALDLYFVAHGSFKALTSKEVLERLGAAGGNKEEAKGKALTAADLKKRGITIAPVMAKREGYGYATFNLLDKVELRATGHSIWSETPDSLVLSADLDRSFAGDTHFPNEWRSLEKNGAGGFNVGPSHPYQGAGYYVKATRLKDSADALFVECHVVFTEPTGWFGGANLLRSKLPPVAQTQIRNLRRELDKASKKN